jgi:hypothetical protein
MPWWDLISCHIYLISLVAGGDDFTRPCRQGASLFFFMLYEMNCNLCRYYLAKKGTRACFDEGADFLDVGAGADVLEVGAVFHVVQVRTVTLAQKSRASSLGQLASRFGKEWASASRLELVNREHFCFDFKI